MKCEKATYAKTRRTFKELNTLIATSPTFPISPTCCIDLKEKKDMIERLEEVIYEDRKNQGALEQRLTEIYKTLHQKDDHISSLKIELRGFQ